MSYFTSKNTVVMESSIGGEFDLLNSYIAMTESLDNIDIVTEGLGDALTKIKDFIKELFKKFREFIRGMVNKLRDKLRRTKKITVKDTTIELKGKYSLSLFDFIKAKFDILEDSINKFNVPTVHDIKDFVASDYESNVTEIEDRNAKLVSSYNRQLTDFNSNTTQIKSEADARIKQLENMVQSLEKIGLKIDAKEKEFLRLIDRINPKDVGIKKSSLSTLNSYCTTYVRQLREMVTSLGIDIDARIKNENEFATKISNLKPFQLLTMDWL